MKKFDVKIKLASLFEHLNGEPGDQFYNTSLFCVDGSPGLWRRIPRTTGGEKNRPLGSISAVVGDVSVELVRDIQAEAELKEAGFGIPEMAQPSTPPSTPPSATPTPEPPPVKPEPPATPAQPDVPDTQRTFPPTGPGVPDSSRSPKRRTG